MVWSLIRVTVALVENVCCQYVSFWYFFIDLISSKLNKVFYSVGFVAYCKYQISLPALNSEIFISQFWFKPFTVEEEKKGSIL